MSDAPMLTPALRSSESFSGELTLGPKIPYHIGHNVKERHECSEMAR